MIDDSHFTADYMRDKVEVVIRTREDRRKTGMAVIRMLLDRNIDTYKCKVMAEVQETAARGGYDTSIKESKLEITRDVIESLNKMAGDGFESPCAEYRRSIMQELENWLNNKGFQASYSSMHDSLCIKWWK
jgi:hypothetical protein